MIATSRIYSIILCELYIASILIVSIIKCLLLVRDEIKMAILKNLIYLEYNTTVEHVPTKSKTTCCLKNKPNSSIL